MSVTVEARPLHGSSQLRGGSIQEKQRFNARFSLTMRKISGPSPGIGHKYDRNVKPLGDVKSGPSPGEGH